MKWIKKQRIITICLKGVLAMVILSAMLGLAACRADTGSHISNTGAGAENHGMQDNASAPESLGSQEGKAEPDSFGSQEGNGEPDSSSVPDHDADQPWADEPRRVLTQEELRGFEEYLNRIDNYGFLMSDYKSPEYINLNEVFYSGAGLEQSPLTEEEREMYLKTVGQPELYTDLVRLGTEQMNGFLTEKTGLTLEAAQQALCDNIDCLGTEKLPLAGALGRRLAEEITAPMDQPPFDRSPLDGYALRAADTAGACREHPVSLTVADTLYAGDAPRVPVAPGQAVRVIRGPCCLPAATAC